MIWINKFRMTDAVTPEIGKKPTTPKRQQGTFIKGPVSCEWFRRCWPLPKRAMGLGLFLWHISGMEKKGKALKVRPKRVKKEFGLSSKSVYRALRDLEKAELITCKRKRGRCARVHIVMVEREGERECL